MRMRRFLALSFGFLVVWTSVLASGPSLMEHLGRGVVAVRTGETEAFVSWRVLGTDPTDIAFNLYRSSGGEAPVKVNAGPVTGATNLADTGVSFATSTAYFVRPIVFGIEGAPSASFTIPANAPTQPYLRVPLQRPAGGVTPTGGSFTYSPNDLSVGDLDGDGEYEIIVKWEPSNALDSSQDGYTGNTLLEAYKLDGTRLWGMDMGVNIRAGPHDTPFIVYDFDGDGRAEITLRTAAGSRDALGNFVADPAKFSGTFPSEPFSHGADYRNASGRALVGPEFLTVLDGLTGAEITSTRFLPARHPDTDFPTSAQLFDVWGDTSGNRQGRFYPPGVAYLDGQRPSLVWGRGYAGGQSGHPGRIAVSSWDLRDGRLTPRWSFDSRGHPREAELSGQGAHNASVADLTGDGRDDIIYGQASIDADGNLLHIGWGHGDALHVTRMDPDRPGLQIYMPHESPASYGPNAVSFQDGATGELIWGISATGDIGRGVAADIDPRFRGFEMWASGGTGGLYNAQQSVPNAVLGPRALQVVPSKPGPINHVVWWTGDLLRELLDGTTISKWNWDTNSVNTILSPSGIASNNGTKSNPGLQADILGDWREEVIWRESGNDALRIYTTTFPTEHRIYTLMHDRQYRVAIAWQNVGYNQPPHPGFYLGHEMEAAPVPNIVTSLSTLLGPPAPVFTGISNDNGSSAADAITNDPTIVLHGTSAPNATVTITRLAFGVLGTTVADGAGLWAFDYSSVALPEGTHLFAATATDAEGNTGVATNPPFAVVVDLTPPGAPTIEGVAAIGDDLVISGVGEPLGRVTVSLAGVGAVGTADVAETGLWSVAIPAASVPPGEASFTATQADLAGNVGAVSAPSAVDTSLAVPAIAGILDDTGISSTDGITRDATPSLTGTGAPGSTVVVFQAGVGAVGTTNVDAGGAWQFMLTATALADGEYSFTAATQGGGGATGVASTPFLATIDTVAPTVVSSVRLVPTSQNTAAETVVFRVAFSETVAGVDSGDFVPVFDGSLAGAVTAVSASSGEAIDVTVGNLVGEGSVRLDVAGGPGLTDPAGNALAADFADGQSYNRLITGSGTWIAASGGLWSSQASWEGGIIGAGVNNAADFSQLDIEGDVAVTLDSPRTVGTLIFGDTQLGSPGAWTLGDGGNAANVLTLQVSAAAPVLSVAPSGLGDALTLNVGLAGNQGLNKQGAGVAVLTRPNALSGATVVSAGVLRTAGSATYSTSTVTIASGGARLEVGGASFAASGTTTVNAGGGSALLINGGDASFGTVQTSNSAGGLIRINGGNVTINTVTLPRSSDGTISFASGLVVAGGTSTIGAIGLGTNNSNGAMSVEGGQVTVTGALTIGNQATSGRGGALRVIGGTLISSHGPTGINIVARTNNTASATFSGGASLVQRFTLGANAVTAGTANLTINGGEVYVGAGGIARLGTLATNLSFGHGTLGALAAWATDLNVTLPAGGNINIRAAGPMGDPFDIAFGGVLSGPGGFTKTGAGVLTLGGASIFSGTAAVAEGTLALSGSLGAGGTLRIDGGTLTGAGTSAKPLVLNAGGTFAPGGAAADSVFAAPGLLWNGGGSLDFDLDATRRFALAGALSRGDEGAYEVRLRSSGPLPLYAEYLLGTFGSTDFAPDDFSFSGLGDQRGAFVLAGGELRFVATGAGPTAEYTHWAFDSGLPAALRGPEDDADNDGIPNLLEFVLDLDPLRPGAVDLVPATLDVDGMTYPAVGYVRRTGLGGVSAAIQASDGPGFAALHDVVEVSVQPRDDGTEQVVVRSAIPLSQMPNQYFRLTATLPAN